MSTIVEEQLQDKQLAPPEAPEEASSPKATQTLRGPLGQRLMSADLIDAEELEAALSHQ
ncbi:MAG: hypothetical protein IH898_10575, partial [Planctomycetes bacterium]|nr:hypothetical protein [Planctomycetota bacterium]